MAASMWEVTQLVLGAPGSGAGDVAEIAHAHGFSAAEVAEVFPLFLDNVSVDYAGSAGVPALAPPVAQPGEGVEEFAARWLGEVGARLHDAVGVVDVVSYDSFGAPAFDLDGMDPGLDLDFVDPGPDTEGVTSGRAADLGGSGPGDDPFATFGSGDEDGGDDDGGDEVADGPEPAPASLDDLADLPDLGDHDPYGLDAATGDDLPDGPEGDLGSDLRDAGTDLDDPSEGGVQFG